MYVSLTFLHAHVEEWVFSNTECVHDTMMCVSITTTTVVHSQYVAGYSQWVTLLHIECLRLHVCVCVYEYYCIQNGHIAWGQYFLLRFFTCNSMVVQSLHDGF